MSNMRAKWRLLNLNWGLPPLIVTNVLLLGKAYTKQNATVGQFSMYCVCAMTFLMYVNQIHLWLPCTLSQHVSVNNLHFVNFITYSRWKPTLATANEREHTIICPRKPMKYDPFLFTWCICTNLKNRHGKIGDKLEFEFCFDLH